MAKIPPPSGSRDEPLQALIIDSWFDTYVGVVSLVRVMNGSISPGDKIVVHSSKRKHLVDRVGVFTPRATDCKTLSAGSVGYLIGSIKEVDAAPVGDTIISAKGADSTAALPGFKKIQPRVFAGLFPVNSDDYEAFRQSLAKLSLNDSSLVYEPESSVALGFGFRCGFLGLLHMEIIQERLEREHQLNLITTAPTVVYEVKTSDGESAPYRETLRSFPMRAELLRSVNRLLLPIFWSRRSTLARHHAVHRKAGACKRRCSISAPRFR